MKTSRKGLIAFTLWISGASAALAAPVPVSSLGWGQSVTVNTNPLTYPVTINGVGIGGGFSGDIAGRQTIFWCVDSQLDVSWGSNVYKANVTPLTGLNQGSWDGSARYEDVTGTGSNGWYYDLGTSFNNAEARYRMAAWLVSQYLQFPAGPTPDPNPTNQAIQAAIWKVMLNKTLSYDADVLGLPVTAGSPSGSSDWIDAAKTFVSSRYDDPFFNNWAIVSGGVVPQGNAWVFDSNHKYQTFLVQTTPEPGFYGLLALALAGLFLAYTKRSAMAATKQKP